jgi:holin-like protein
MLGFAILLGFNLLGLVVKDWTHVPLPANLIGLMLFAAALFTKIIKLEWVEQSAGFLNKHMLLFYVPFLVGTMTFFPYIWSHLVPVLVGLVGGTLVVLTVTGWTTSALSGPSSGSREETERDA